MPHVAIIGAGFSGLSAACFLAKEGFAVTVLEKNSTAGGRARQFQAAGFTFDMGPSWYWMPDVFERFFSHFGKRPADFYKLGRLDPSYRIFFGRNDFLDVPASLQGLYAMAESLEPGSSKNFSKFLESAQHKYDLGVGKLVYNPGLSLTELLDVDVIKNSFRLNLFDPFSSYIKKYFSNSRLIRMLEFPVLFLGASPERTPALYSLMNYADMILGTWYPEGGMYAVVGGLVSLAKSLDVKFEFDSAVEELKVNSVNVKGCVINGRSRPFDYVIASADYQYVEQKLLPKGYRRYSQSYWEKKTLAPSALIYFVGLNKKIGNLLHHSIFVDQDFHRHVEEIYSNPQWPSSPQFYVSCPSKTDPTVAPPGCDNLFILIPVATDLQDTEDIRQKYFQIVLQRLEHLLAENIRDHVVFKRSYAHSDFSQDYNAFKGNAYGLANTLRQTANLRPSIVSRKLNNLFYTGQLTVPGPGVPAALISGQVAAKELIRRHKKS